MSFFRRAAFFACVPLLLGVLVTPVNAQDNLRECSMGGNFQGGAAAYRLRDNDRAHILLRLTIGDLHSENLTETTGLPAILEIGLPIWDESYERNSVATLHAGYFVRPGSSEFEMFWQTTITTDGSEARTYETTNLDIPGDPDFARYRTQTYVSLGNTDALVAAIHTGKSLNVKVAVEGAPERFYSADLDLSRLTPVLARLEQAAPVIRQMAANGQCRYAP